MYREMYLVVSVCGSDSFGEYMKSFVTAYHTPIDELEMHVLLKNASVERRNDEQGNHDKLQEWKQRNGYR